MKRFIALWGIILFTTLKTHGQTLTGWVKDAESNESLPFATIGFKGTSLGTITNQEGYFELNVPKSAKNSEVVISYMGYKSTSIKVSDFTKTPEVILLKPSIVTLEEIVVRPLSPEEYIKRVVRNMEKAAPQEAYSAKAYYREKFKENNGYIAYNEGIFKFHYPEYEDTTSNQYQLALYETAKNPQELQFMKTMRDKKDDRKRRKAEKKGKEYEEDESEMIQVNFGGPKEILDLDINKLEAFMDSTQFRKFRYEFGTPVTYQDRELMVINFDSKGKVDHLKTEGKIYIDLKANAIASVEYTGDFVIPILLEPILFSFGISISTPRIKKVVRSQFIDGYWYPDYYTVEAHAVMKKRYMFHENEVSNFDIQQLLKINDIIPGDSTEIPKDKRFDSKEKPEEQVYNDQNWKWSDFDRVVEEGEINQ